MRKLFLSEPLSTSLTDAFFSLDSRLKGAIHTDNSEVVILVHGLFMTGLELRYLAHRLQRRGFETRGFFYPSVHRSPTDVAERLWQVVQTVDATAVHFVCHSLGGLVIRYLFANHPYRAAGRVVTLGTPHQGSCVAHHLATMAAGRWLLGRSYSGGLSGEVPRWYKQRQLGVIAGNRSMGLGRFVASLNRPNDGTVALEETELYEAKDHIVLPVSHFGMLTSKQVADQTAHFLQNGCFRHPPKVSTT